MFSWNCFSFISQILTVTVCADKFQRRSQQLFDSNHLILFIASQWFQIIISVQTLDYRILIWCTTWRKQSCRGPCHCSLMIIPVMCVYQSVWIFLVPSKQLYNSQIAARHQRISVHLVWNIHHFNCSLVFLRFFYFEPLYMERENKNINLKYTKFISSWFCHLTLKKK